MLPLDIVGDPAILAVGPLLATHDRELSIR